MKEKDKKLIKTEFTQQEIWQVMRGNVHKSKKDYKRKSKHKKDDYDDFYPDRDFR